MTFSAKAVVGYCVSSLAVVLAVQVNPRPALATETKPALNNAGQVAFVRSPSGNENRVCFGGTNAGAPCLEGNGSVVCTGGGNCLVADPDQGLDLVLRTGGNDTVIATNGMALPPGGGMPRLTGFARRLSINDQGVVAVRVGIQAKECAGGTNDGDKCLINADCATPGTCEEPGIRKCNSASPNPGIRCTVNTDCTPGACNDHRECEGGPNNGADCKIEADCPGDAGPDVVKCKDIDAPNPPSTESDADNEQAIITATAGNTVSVIARTGDMVGGQTITSPDPEPVINNAGQVGFTAQVTPGRNAVIRFTPGVGLELLCVEGDMVGGFPVGPDDKIDMYGMNQSGQVLMEVNTTGGAPMIVLLDGPGSKTLIARSGDTYDEVDNETLNELGQVLFKGAIGAPFNEGPEVERLVLWDPNTGLQEIAVEGQSAGGNAAYDGFGVFHCMNDIGHVAFVAGVRHGQCLGGADSGERCTENSTCDSNNCQLDNCDQRFDADISDGQCQAVFLWDGTTITQIAQTTSADAGNSPTGAAGFEFDSIAPALACNNSDCVCFFAEEDVPLVCQAGPDQGTACTDNDECENDCGEQRRCVGGSDAGTACFLDADCNSQYCAAFEEEPSGFFCWSPTGGVQAAFIDGEQVAGSSNTALTPPMQTFDRILNESNLLAFPVNINTTLPNDEDLAENRIVLRQLAKGGPSPVPVLSWLAATSVCLALFAIGFRRLSRRRIHA